MSRINFGSVLGLFAACLIVSVVLRSVLNTEITYFVLVIAINSVLLYFWDKKLPILNG